MSLHANSERGPEVTASPATTTSPSIRYLEDLFMHARSRSRRVSAASKRIHALLRQEESPHANGVELTARQANAVLDELVNFENEVGNFLASICASAAAQAAQVAAIAPGYYEDERFVESDPAKIDRLVSPIFEAAGIADDFISWREAFPSGEANA